MIYLDKYAYFNGLKDVHPAEKCIFAVLTLIIVLFSDSLLLGIVVILSFTLLILFKAKIPVLFYCKLLLIPLYFLAAGTLTVAINFISPGQKAVFSFFLFHREIGMTAAGFAKALQLFFKAWAGISCLYFLILTVPILGIVHILKTMRVPALFLELMIIIYRCIFVFLDTCVRIHTSQTSRLGYKNMRTGLKSTGKLVASLFVIALKRAEDMYHALESRCFTGEFNVLHKEYRLSQRNLIAILATQSLFLIISVFF